MRRSYIRRACDAIRVAWMANNRRRPPLVGRYKTPGQPFPVDWIVSAGMPNREHIRRKRCFRDSRFAIVTMDRAEVSMRMAKS